MKFFSKILFPSHKRSRRSAIALCALIFLVLFSEILHIFTADASIFEAETLKSLSEFGMTIILAIAALGIAVLQSNRGSCNEEAKENQETKENKETANNELYIRYIFEMIKSILIVTLGFFLSVSTMGGYSLICALYSIVVTMAVIQVITRTMVYFIKFFNIKD